ncbi:MAG: hypothetical protein AAFW89_11145 [Bacteroidota bacterium]
MIRIRADGYKISLCVALTLYFSFQLKAQLPMGSRALSLGQAVSALPNGQWSVFGNPALLHSDGVSLGFYSIRNYGITALTDVSATSAFITKLGTGAVGFHRFGDELFNETRIRAGYQNEIRNVKMGVIVNYTHISFGGDYGAGGATGVDLGIAAPLTEGLWLGAIAVNINQPQYRFAAYHEDLPRSLSLGLTYRLDENALFALDMIKDTRFPMSYRGGIELDILNVLHARIGVTTEPLTYAFGIGYQTKRWAFNIGLQRHEEELLGLSPGIDFSAFVNR